MILREFRAETGSIKRQEAAMKHDPADVGFAWAMVRATAGPMAEMAASWLGWSLIILLPISYMVRSDHYYIVYLSLPLTLVARTYGESKALARHRTLLWKLLVFVELIMVVVAITSAHAVESCLLICALGWSGVLLAVGTLRRVVCLLNGGAGWGLMIVLLLVALAVAVMAGATCGVMVGLGLGLTGVIPHSQIQTVGLSTAKGATLLLASSSVCGVLWGLLVCAAPGKPRARENYRATNWLEAVLTKPIDEPWGSTT
jgi:hypothetical protein